MTFAEKRYIITRLGVNVSNPCPHGVCVGQKSIRRCRKWLKKYSYETIFIIDATLDEETVTALKDKFTTLIEQNGELESVDEWGKRRLAYEINDRTEGFYYLVNFKADSEFPKELERQYKITEGILRTIVIRKDEE